MLLQLRRPIAQKQSGWPTPAFVRPRTSINTQAGAANTLNVLPMITQIEFVTTQQALVPKLKRHSERDQTLFPSAGATKMTSCCDQRLNR